MSQSILSQALTREQQALGFTLQVDDHVAILMHEEKPIARFPLETNIDLIRKEADAELTGFRFAEGK